MAVRAYGEALGVSGTSESGYIDPSLVIAISEQPEDLIERRQAETHLKLGATALKSEVYVEGKNISSLKEAVHQAENSEVFRSYVKKSAETDVGERIEKVEFITDVDLEVNAEGELLGAGQTLKQTQLNSWSYASGRWQMAERVEAENRNVFRLHNELAAGSLEDYHFIELSPAADNLDNKAMDDEGFFRDTMTLVLRSTTIKKGKVKMESAFVAGVKKPGEERQDIDTIIEMGKILGVDFEGKTASDIIDSPLLISKSLLPNGIVDLVKLYDNCGDNTFFGQDKAGGSYEAVIARSLNKKIMFSKKAEAIAEELIKRKTEIITESDATRLLNQISGKHMILAAIKDTTINPNVFGRDSELNIFEARRLHLIGDEQRAWQETNKAIKNDASRSCPGGASGSSKEDTYGNALGDTDSEENQEWHGGKIINNAKCRSCKEVKAEVGACHICKACVGKIHKK